MLIKMSDRMDGFATISIIDVGAMRRRDGEKNVPVVL